MQEGSLCKNSKYCGSSTGFPFRSEFCSALLIGGLLGIERGRKNRPAGFRTYMLVSLGAAIVMMTNQYVFQTEGGSDPVRMGAQVVSGIGFLGAGSILVTGKNQVKGITTAAGLWTAGCCGLAVGIGFYEGALAGGAAIYLVMAVLQRLDNKIHSRSKWIDLYAEFQAGVAFSTFFDYAREHGFSLTEIQIMKDGFTEDSGLCVLCTAKSEVPRSHMEMMQLLGSAPGVHRLEEV